MTPSASSANPNRRARPTAPQTDEATNTPSDNALPNLAQILRLLEILLTYGRHMAETFNRRAAAPGFHLIARPFGASNQSVILAHIRRGILRATALRHVLRQRAARGQDLTPPPMRVRVHRPNAPRAPSRPKSQRKPAWRDDWLDNAANPLDPALLPSFEALVKQVRRRPIGRTLGAIAADLGVAPVLSQARFWNELFMTILRHDGSPAIYGVRRWRREQYFDEQQERVPTMDRSWPPGDIGGGRRDILAVLGFLAGDPPAEPPMLRDPDPAPGHPAPWIQKPAAPAPARPRTTGPP